MVADPIADLITRIKNASAAGKPRASLPFSNLVNEIAEILKRHGFVKEVAVHGKKPKKTIELELAYDGTTPIIRGAERISRLSKRVYVKKTDIKPVKFGQGIMVISTSKGLRTDKESRKEGVGGEALFKIW